VRSLGAVTGVGAAQTQVGRKELATIFWFFFLATNEREGSDWPPTLER
jgi:hypothetical protein